VLACRCKIARTAFRVAFRSGNARSRSLASFHKSRPPPYG